MKQSEKVFALMCYNRDTRQWWYPPMFMKEELGNFFVGYEASARLSELASKYPTMVESKKQGKYMLRRIKWETINEWLPTLPQNLKDIEARYRP